MQRIENRLPTTNLTSVTFLVLLFSFHLAICQNDTTKIKNRRHPFASIDMCFGETYFLKSVSSQLNSASQKFDAKSFHTLSIGSSNTWLELGAWFNVNLQNNLIYQLPLSITINDSVRANFSRYHWSYGAGKMLFQKNKHFRLTWIIGFNTGASILKTQNNGSYRNPFFAPKIELIPKLIVKRLSIALHIFYCSDITAKSWKYKGPQTQVLYLRSFNQSTLPLLFSVGYCFTN